MRLAFMPPSPATLQNLGRILGIAAWFVITYALWMMSEGGPGEGLLLLGIGIAALAVGCEVWGKRLRP